ncbi:MAG: class II glutamine amidotransferase, partial [Lachnospiraceae bacterium]|nr:class II glutamine amidotransferase [Lachnospiraceae bacterium]
IYEQEGDTDSERILYYLIDRMDEESERKKRPLSAGERAEIMEDILLKITPENKINLLLSDGELLYVHTNYKKSLHIHKAKDSVFFSTKPLDEEDWEELPLNTLLVFKEDSLIYEGRQHENEFFDDPEKLKYLYLDFAGM